MLSVYKPTNDTEGIDLIIVKNGMFQPIFLQVKSRFNLNKGTFIIDISKKTFNAHHSYYIICAYFDLNSLEVFDNMLIIPSDLILNNAIHLDSKKRPSYRIVASLKSESKGKWSKHLTNKTELANKLIEKFEEMSKYIK